MGEVSLWDFFNKLSDCDGPKAECRMCSRVLACSTSANLKVHLQRKHGDTINVQQYLKQGKQKENKSNGKECSTKTLVWRNFTKVEGDKFACCNLCSKIISYKSTIWNLKTHLKLVHVDIYPMLIALALEEDEQCVKVPENAENDEEDVASYFSEETGGHMRCSVCNETVSSDQRRSHLEEQHQYQQHARKKHDLGPGDAEDSEEGKGESKQKFSRPKRSIVWLYFTCVDPDAKVSQCNICKKLLSHRSSVTNLKQHLEMKHPNLKISVRKHRSSGGELYGVDTGTKLEDADDGNNDQDIQTKDAVYTEIIYLEEEDQELNLSRKKEKEPKYNTRSSKTPKSNSKPTRKRRKTIETSSESCFTLSDEEYKPDYWTEMKSVNKEKKKSVNKETDELEKFGSYIASLLRTVPKKYRTKLQMEIVNRIMTEKLKLEDSDDSSIKSAGKEKGTRLISVVEEISKMNTSEVTATEASM